MIRATRFLTLLRHGATQAEDGVCVGQLDVALSTAGWRAAMALAENWSHEPPQRLICSDLTRARDTAALLTQGGKLRLEQEPRLREINLGEWQGQRWDDIHNSDPHRLQRWGQDWVNQAAPGGETARQLYNRVADWYTEFQQGKPITTLIVAHAGSLAALSCKVHGLPVASLLAFRFEHCAPLQLI